MPAGPDNSVDALPASLVSALKTVTPLRDKTWSLEPLAGGITNQNYLICTREQVNEFFVLRVAGVGTEQLGIDRGQEHACAIAAAKCGAGCEVIAYLPEHGALIVRYAQGQPLVVGDLEGPDVMARTVEVLRLFHQSGEVPGEFRPLETIRGYMQRANASGVQLPDELFAISGKLAWIEMETRQTREVRPCHNDLLPANLIDDGQRVRLIDWEYAAMGDVMFDLGNLAENHLLSEAAEIRLLQLYYGSEQPHEAVAWSDLARLWKMRLMSAMRESTWGYFQSAISKLDFDFVSYGRKHLDRALELQERIGPGAWRSSTEEQS
jgi:thiamine kinase-like enzyme